MLWKQHGRRLMRVALVLGQFAKGRGAAGAFLRRLSKEIGGNPILQMRRKPCAALISHASS